MTLSREERIQQRAERERQARFESVCAILAERFKEASRVVLLLQADLLISTSETAQDLAVRRADDTEAMGRLLQALKEAEAAAAGLSQPTRQRLFHELYMAGARVSLGRVSGIVAGVAGGIEKTPFSSRENVAAIFVVHEARRIWAKNTGLKAPAGRDLNLSTPFGGFLTDLFKVMSHQGSPRPAFQAWHKYKVMGLFE